MPKRRMSLYQNLAEAVNELCEVLGIDVGPVTTRARRAISQIRKHKNETFAVVDMGPDRSLIWTKEGGRRKLLFLSRRGNSERFHFNKWREMPYASRLRSRGIHLGFARYARNVEDIRIGADEEILE